MYIQKSSAHVKVFMVKAEVSLFNANTLFCSVNKSFFYGAKRFPFHFPW